MRIHSPTVWAWCVTAALLGPCADLLAESAGPGPGRAALEAARDRQYLFVLFSKDDGEATEAMRVALATGLAGRRGEATSVSVRVTDPAEKAVVDRFGVSRAPLPLVLAVAPNGAVTRAFTGRLDPREVGQAFVSPCTARCLKALQDRKLVLLCVRGAVQPGIVQGVRDFQADARFTKATEVITLDPADPGEAGVLKQLQIDPRAAAPTTVFLAPPGTTLGKFSGAVTKEQLVEKLKSAQAGCCPGGCCPGGCCGPNGGGPKR